MKLEGAAYYADQLLTPGHIQVKSLEKKRHCKKVKKEKKERKKEEKKKNYL